jgi:hypothetical protein
MRRLGIAEAGNLEDINLGGLTGLTELTLDLTMEQSQLPPSIGRLNSLQRLVFYNSGGLTTLPDEIGRLTNLTCLRVDDCPSEVFTLPEAISSLVRLQFLSVSSAAGGYVLHVPQTIRLPASLLELHLHCFDIQLPASLTNLTQLSVMDFQCSAATLDTLPALCNMPSLRVLKADLSRTISDARVGEMLMHASLTSLRVTRHRHDNLGAVVEALPTLTNLRELHIDILASGQGPPNPAQPAVRKPPSMSSISKLTHLTLATVRAKLPSWVFKLTSLQHLTHTLYDDCNSNYPYTGLNHAVSNLASLRVLQLPRKALLCSSVTRLSKLTKVHAQWDGDTEHQYAVAALLKRGVKFVPLLVLSNEIKRQ